VDSVTYWAREYPLDGVRFDLMGLIDLDTLNSVMYVLYEIPFVVANPHVRASLVRGATGRCHRRVLLTYGLSS
jgi:Type II secretory pathway, pullulanase PulA and related glycosidases